MFKAIHRIHWKSLVVRKIYGFNDCSASVWSVTKKINEVVYFTITGKFYRDFFSFTVLAVDFIGCMTDELIEKTNGSLCYVIAV